MKKKSIWSPLFITVVLLLMYLPIFVVVIYSFNSNTIKNASAFTGFTLDWYSELFSGARGFGPALVTSLELALYSCAISVVLGTLGAVGMARRRLKRPIARMIAGFAENVVTLPIMLPEIILGLAFMAVFYELKLPFGMVTLVLSHVTFCVPYIYILVKGRLVGMDTALPEAARDLGAGPVRVFFDITLPII